MSMHLIKWFLLILLFSKLTLADTKFPGELVRVKIPNDRVFNISASKELVSQTLNDANIFQNSAVNKYVLKLSESNHVATQQLCEDRGKTFKVRENSSGAAPMRGTLIVNFVFEISQIRPDKKILQQHAITVWDLKNYGIDAYRCDFEDQYEWVLGHALDVYLLTLIDGPDLNKHLEKKIAEMNDPRGQGVGSIIGSGITYGLIGTLNTIKIAGSIAGEVVTVALENPEIISQSLTVIGEEHSKMADANEEFYKDLIAQQIAEKEFANQLEGESSHASGDLHQQQSGSSFNSSNSDYQTVSDELTANSPNETVSETSQIPSPDENGFKQNNNLESQSGSSTGSEFDTNANVESSSDTHEDKATKTNSSPCFAKTASGLPIESGPCGYVFADLTEVIEFTYDEYESQFMSEGGNIKSAEISLNVELRRKAQDKCEGAGYTHPYIPNQPKKIGVESRTSDCKTYNRLGVDFYLCEGTAEFWCGSYVGR